MDIKVVPLPYERQMELAELVGYASQSNERWHQAVTAGSVRAIGDKKIPYPQHPAHIRAVIQELGDEEMARVDAQVWSYRGEGAMPEVTVRPLSALERWDLSDIGQTAHNIPAWRALAVIACTVRSLGGMPLEFPRTRKELLARVKVLGWEGMEAASAALRAPADAEDE